MPGNPDIASKAHRHVAIIFTDIVGYTTLMGKDEEKALDILARNKKIHNRIINQFNGSLIKEMGDGMLVCFNIASDAVRCAVEIQKTCVEAEIPLKIGIHEGEVLFAESDILGDSVNLASRIQDSTAAGGISISESVYRNIKNKSGIETAYLGEKSFKNVDESIKIYSIITNKTADESTTEKSRSKVPNKKSMIVLPFENMSSDPEQEYFSDGLTEEIITDLSYIRDLLVISRSSAMTFKGSKLTIKEIAQKVDVTHVLEGSVRKAGNRLRITAQLIEANTDTHLWAAKYDGVLDDIFDIQEKVSRSIANSLKLKLTTTEIEKINHHPITNLKALEYYQIARQDMWVMTQESCNRALNLLDEATKLIGENEIFYSLKGNIFWSYVNNGIKPPQEFEYWLDKAELMADKAFEINPESDHALVVMGAIHQQRGNYKKAFSYFKKAVDLNPNNPEGVMWLAFARAVTGRTDESLKLFKHLKQIDPLTPVSNICYSYYPIHTGDFEASIEPLSLFYKLDHSNPMGRIFCAYGMALANKKSQAIEFINWEKPENWVLSLGLFFREALRGNKQEALNQITGDLKIAAWWDDYYSLMMAQFYALINEKTEAVKWLDHAVDYGIINYSYLNKYDPFLENIRRDKRFKKLMQKVKYEWENFKI